MPSVTFEGETHGEIVVKVRRWLASVDGQEESGLTATEAVTQGAELTKDALRIIASAAPEPIAQSDIVKGLTNMGYKATDATKSSAFTWAGRSWAWTESGRRCTTATPSRSKTAKCA